jgi:hypothetical protein
MKWYCKNNLNTCEKLKYKATEKKISEERKRFLQEQLINCLGKEFFPQLISHTKINPAGVKS